MTTKTLNNKILSLVDQSISYVGAQLREMPIRSFLLKTKRKTHKINQKELLLKLTLGNGYSFRLQYSVQNEK